MVIAVFHQPAVSCSRHGATADVVEAWVDRFESAGVDLVLQGHDHNYQHFVVGSVYYVVSGGGGRDLYEVTECPGGLTSIVQVAEHHFLMIERRGDVVAVAALRANATLLDRFEIVVS